MYKKVHLRLNLRVHFKIELPFKLHMLMHLLEYKCAKNNSMGVLEGVPRDAINNLYKDAQEATVTCECKQKIVNILLF